MRAAGGWWRRGWRGAVCGLGLGCASGPGGVESPTVERAREMLRTGRARQGNLVLRCEPGDADVYLDGVAQGFCSDFADAQGGLRVGEGMHRVDVKKEGHWPYTTYYEPGRARAVLTIRLREMTPGGGQSP